MTRRCSSVPRAPSWSPPSTRLVDGVHFPHGSPPASIGHRALAVNLSDLAAMGARPAWALLALTLPQVEEPWLSEFAAGMAALARAHDVALVGGDTTSRSAVRHRPGAGTRAERIRAAALGRQARAMRSSCRDTPGDAAAGLAIEQGKLAAAGEAAAYLRERFLYPAPRLALGERLRGYATACIDVSDGLLGDAGKAGARQRLRRGDRVTMTCRSRQALVSAVGRGARPRARADRRRRLRAVLQRTAGACRQTAGGVAAGALGLHAHRHAARSRRQPTFFATAP